MSSKLQIKVLLLNNGYEPMAVITAKKVFKLLSRENNPITVHEYYEKDFFYSAGGKEFKVPSVVRLNKYIKHRKKRLKKKKEIIRRDQSSCVYCEQVFPESLLTLDHIIPKSKGGTNDPFNLATCCKQCNQLKGDRTPEEANMKIPKSKGILDKNIEFLSNLSSDKDINSKWIPYLF